MHVYLLGGGARLACQREDLCDENDAQVILLDGAKQNILHRTKGTEGSP